MRYSNASPFRGKLLCCSYGYSLTSVTQNVNWQNNEGKKQKNVICKLFQKNIVFSLIYNVTEWQRMPKKCRYMSHKANLHTI